MSKVARIKQEAVQHAVPQSHAEVVEAIAEIGQRQRSRDRIQAAMNDELAAIRQRYEEDARPHAEAIQALSRGVQLWCETHRDQLTQSGRVKFARLASGEIKWRMRPPSVSARGLENVLQALRNLKLERFIRIKEELNKEAVLAEPEAVQHIKGITITQKEDFVIVPFETELEEIA